MNYLKDITDIIQAFWKTNRIELKTVTNSENNVSEFVENIDLQSEKIKSNLGEVNEDVIQNMMAIVLTSGVKKTDPIRTLKNLWQYYTSRFNNYSKISFFLALVILVKICSAPVSVFDDFVKYGVFSGVTFGFYKKGIIVSKQNYSERIYAKESKEKMNKILGLNDDYSHVKVFFNDVDENIIDFLDKYGVNYYRIAEISDEDKKYMVSNHIADECYNFLTDYEDGTDMNLRIKNYSEKHKLDFIDEKQTETIDTIDTYSKKFIKILIESYKQNNNSKDPTSKKHLDVECLRLFEQSKNETSKIDITETIFVKKDLENISDNIFEFITEKSDKKNTIIPVMLKMKIGEKILKTCIFQRKELLAASLINNNYVFPLVWEIDIDDENIFTKKILNRSE